jgi:hypothetical protein
MEPHLVLVQNNFGDTVSDGLAGPMGLLIVVLLGIATVLLIRNMNSRLRRLPDRFPGQPDAPNGDSHPAAPVALAGAGGPGAPVSGGARPAGAAPATGRLANPGSEDVELSGPGPII